MRRRLVAGVKEDLLVGAAEQARSLGVLRVGLLPGGAPATCSTSIAAVALPVSISACAYSRRLLASFGSRRLIASASPAISSYSRCSCAAASTRRFASSSSSSLLNPRRAASTLRRARSRSSSWVGASLMPRSQLQHLAQRPAEVRLAQVLGDRVAPGAVVLHRDVLDHAGAPICSSRSPSSGSKPQTGSSRSKRLTQRRATRSRGKPSARVQPGCSLSWTSSSPSGLPSVISPSTPAQSATRFRQS